MASSGSVDESTRQKLCEVYAYIWGYISITTTNQPVYLPDLTVTDICRYFLFFFSSQPSQRVDFTIKVKNSGLGNPGNHYLEVYILNDQLFIEKTSH